MGEDGHKLRRGEHWTGPVYDRLLRIYLTVEVIGWLLAARFAPRSSEISRFVASGAFLSSGLSLSTAFPWLGRSPRAQKSRQSRHNVSCAVTTRAISHALPLPTAPAAAKSHSALVRRGQAASIAGVDDWMVASGGGRRPGRVRVASPGQGAGPGCRTGAGTE